MIKNEKQVIDFIKCPIPKKQWDKKSSFTTGVALVKRITGEVDYAVCSFNSEIDENIKIIKDFGLVPFVEIVNVFPIPEYMEDNISDMDLDEGSKEAMEQLLQEKQDVVDKDVKKEKVVTYEWGYDFIQNKQEAIAFLKTKQIKGRIPVNEDVLKAKLREMYHSQQKKK